MKKAFSFILVLILLVGMMVPAGAAGTPTLSVSSGEVKAGETVTLTVSIKDNPGIAAYMLYFYYDTSAFTMDPNSDVTVAGAFTVSKTLFANNLEAVKKGDNYEGLPGKDGAVVAWMNLSGTNVSNDGEMLKIKLKANEDIGNGDYTIGLGYSPSNSCNAAGEDVVFKTVSGKITVTGGTTNKPADDDAEKEVPVFTDVDGHWAQKYINDAAALGLIEGYQGLYRPNDTMTRAECVTILWRAVGEPKPARKATFSDLDPNQKWYHDAVAWAEQNNVVNGMGGGKFEPNGQVTREQLATILHRMAGAASGMELMFTAAYDAKYVDSAKVGAWAKNALYWAIYNEIYCGVRSTDVGTALAPNQPANRAQIAVMIVRYLAYIDS